MQWYFIVLIILAAYVVPIFACRYFQVEAYRAKCMTKGHNHVRKDDFAILLSFFPLFNIGLMVLSYIDYISSRRRAKLGWSYWFWGDHVKDTFIEKEKAEKEYK